MDADGDPSTAVLTIDITASTGNVSDTDVTVDESGLDNGSYHGSQLGPNGEFDTDGQITASGGTPPYTYTLTDPANGTYGTLTLNADGSYSYTLDTPFTDGVNENSRNVVNGAESSVTVVGPSRRRARIARRVGSARAANVVLRGSVAMCFTNQLDNRLVR